MATTNFLQFDPSKQLIADDTSYHDSSYRMEGVSPGIAPPDIHNKLYYQMSTMIAAFARAMVMQGFTANDTDIDELSGNINQMLGARADTFFDTDENGDYMPGIDSGGASNKFMLDENLDIMPI